MKVFISGSISISKLPSPAVEKLDSIINKYFTILVGDAKGVDLQVQKYLSKKNYNNVIVYFIGKEIRNNVGKWKSKEIVAVDIGKKGRELYTLKDIAMANDADYGLMIWDGASAGTLHNMKEMKTRNKRFYVILNGKIIDEKNIDIILNTQNKQTENKLQLELS
jgi:hypothetical protein